MGGRDPRELFAVEKSLRARKFARKHRRRGVALWIIVMALVASLAMAAYVPHAIAGYSLRRQLAAAGSAGESQGFFPHLLCRLLSIGCPSVDQPVVRDDAPLEPETTAQAVSRTPISSTPAPSTGPVGASPPPPAVDRTIAGPPPAQPIRQTVVNQPVIERVVETQRVVTEGGITETTLADRLNQLENKLRSLIFSQSSQRSAQTSAVYNEVALSQRIDNLSNTTITNPTITGGSITGTSIAGTITNAIQSVRSRHAICGAALVESPGGISPPGAPRTVHAE